MIEDLDRLIDTILDRELADIWDGPELIVEMIVHQLSEDHHVSPEDREEIEAAVRRWWIDNN